MIQINSQINSGINSAALDMASAYQKYYKYKRLLKALFRNPNL